MQDYIETEGNTVEEAIESALAGLGLEREQVTVTIISEPTKGILKFGTKPAKVRVTCNEKDTTARDVPDTLLKEILSRMGFDAEVESHFIDGSTHLNMTTDSPALLIGKHGQTLDAIERLLNCMINRASLVKRRIFIDIEGYRERREHSLVELAHREAARVRQTNREIVLAPMSSRDRRIIHLALKADEMLFTYSQGEGEMRRVAIATQAP